MKGLLIEFSMDLQAKKEETVKPFSAWINIIERDGWILVNFEGRKLGILISTLENGQTYLRVAGYHAGETRWIGERRNVLSIKVEVLPQNTRNALVPLIRDVLPAELRTLPISFL